MTGQVFRVARDRVHIVTLTVPERRNALSREILAELRGCLGAAESDGAAAVVLTGEGGTFSAGADFTDLTGTEDDLAFDQDLDGTVEVVRTLPVPVVAAIEGACVGAAVELALACDLRVAGADAWLHLPAVRLGLLYNPRSIARLHRTLPRDVLTRLLLWCERFTAQEAHRVGLVSEATGTGGASERAALWCASMADLAGDALARTKQLLSELDDGGGDVEQWQAVRARLLGSAERREAIADAHSRHLHAGRPANGTSP